MNNTPETPGKVHLIINYSLFIIHYSLSLTSVRRFWWAIRDSNPGPTGYEPVALTN